MSNLQDTSLTLLTQQHLDAKKKRSTSDIENIVETFVLVIFENHLNTLPDPALIPMNARRANMAQNMIAGYGSPLLFVLLKILGAFPDTARPSIF